MRDRRSACVRERRTDIEKKRDRQTKRRGQRENKFKEEVFRYFFCEKDKVLSFETKMLTVDGRTEMLTLP